MTASILLSMVQQFALENILSVVEFSEDLQIGFRNGTADLEHRAD